MNLDKLNKKIMVGIPIMDTIPGEAFGFHVQTVLDVIKIFGHGNVMTACPVGVSPHDYARYIITNEAIRREVDYLFFMDDDTVTPKGGFGLLWDLMKNGVELKGEKERQYPVAVSGYYLRRGKPYTPVWSVERDGEWFGVTGCGGIARIHISGLGCCLIDFNWIKKNVPPPWFKMTQKENHTIISDDVSFFTAIKNAGGLVVGHGDVVCPHIGNREFIVPESVDALRLVHSCLERCYERAQKAGDTSCEVVSIEPDHIPPQEMRVVA